MNPKPEPARPIYEAQMAFENFLKVRRDHPLVIPPAAEVTKETTLEEKYFGFLYWWIPGNIWHNALRTQYSGRHMYSPYRRKGGRPLEAKHMPVPSVHDASINVPQALPSSPPGKLDHKLKSQAERDLRAYERRRKENRSEIPKTEYASAETPPERIYFAFPFWWFPENFYHDKVAAGHEHLAADILGDHIRAGFKFPDPPAFHEGRVLDVATSYVEDSPSSPPPQLLGNSPESAALDSAATSIDGSDGPGANSADTGPAGTP